MVPVDDILKALFDTFDKSALEDFRRFLVCNALVKKWMIAADFCLHDKERPNHVFALTVIPYDDYHSTLQDEIKEAIPKDLKKTRDVPAKTKVCLLDPRRFHFAFVLKSPPDVFNDMQGRDRKVVARECLRKTLDMLKQHGRSQKTIERFKQLVQKAERKNFPVELLADMFLFAYLLSFVTLALARERRNEIVGWFSDRDNMTTWCDGVLWDIALENVYGLASLLNISLPDGLVQIGVPTSEEELAQLAASAPGAASVDPMWFDDLIRLPDYIAGVMAAWNLATNQLPTGKAKFQHLAEDVIANAKNMAVMTLTYGDYFQAGRTVFQTAS